MTTDKKTEVNFSRYDAGGDYLKSLDLLIDGVFKSFRLTVSEFIPAGTLKSADKKLINKPVIGFKEAKKRLILGATSQSILHLLCGSDDGNKAIGTVVTVEARIVDAFGEKVYGLRIIPPKGTVLTRGVRIRLGDKAEWHNPAILMKDDSQS